VEVDQNRVTASATYSRRFGPGARNARNNWQTTAAWGRDINDPGHTLDALLVESALNFNRTHTLFARFETVEKDELFQPPSPLAGSSFWVSKLSAGYIYDFPETHRVQLGIGALGSIHFLTSALEDAYGERPTSFMLFARARW